MRKTLKISDGQHYRLKMAAAIRGQKLETTAETAIELGLRILMDDALKHGQGASLEEIVNSVLTNAD